MANRWGIPKEVEEAVRQRDLCCVYCGVSFINSVFAYKSRPTWEHIINDIRLNSVDNIALCCASCNASKGSKLLKDWLKSKFCQEKGISKMTVAKVVQNYIDNE